MKKIYEYAILLAEKSDRKTDDHQAKILVSPTVVLADDEAQVNMVAARAIPDEYLGELERITLAVRPF